jgi:hypothetical protein
METPLTSWRKCSSRASKHGEHLSFSFPGDAGHHDSDARRQRFRLIGCCKYGQNIQRHYGMPIQMDRWERPLYDERGCLNHKAWLPAVFEDALIHTPTFTLTADRVVSIDEAAEGARAHIPESQESRDVDRGTNLIVPFVESGTDG